MDNKKMWKKRGSKRKKAASNFALTRRLATCAQPPRETLAIAAPPQVSEPQEDAPAIGAADGGHANQVLVRLASVHITPPSSGPGFCARAAKRRHEGPAPGSPAAVPGALVGGPTPLALGGLREDETEQEQPAPPPPPPPPPPFFGDRVIWDLGCMETTLGQLTCPNCSDAHLLFSRDAEGNLLDQQQGLRHKYIIVCDRAECDFALDMESSRVMQTGRQGRPPAEVNVAAVAAAEMSGLRQKALDLMFVAMGVRGIHNRRTYTRHSRPVQDAMVQLGHAQIIENRRIVRAFLEEQGVEADEHNRIPVTVAADGNWPVRGACSACGHGSLIFRDDMLQGGKNFVIAQGFRHKHCAVCSYYNSNEHAKLLEPPQHACKKNWDDTSKAMETDILINLVGEVGQHCDKAREGGALVPRDETSLLRVEYVVCDEDSSFMVRIMDQLPEDLRPGKLSDVNHLANNFFKALMMVNLEAHVFGDHSMCHLCPTKDANGVEHQWCANARGATDHPQRILFEEEPEVSRADPSDKKKRVKVKLPLRKRLHEVISKFGSLEVMEKAVHGLSSNPNESLHATGTHMLGGKQKFHGQSDFFEATMRGAVMKNVSGQAFQLDVVEKLGLPVTDAMHARYAQIDADRAAKREFLYANPNEALKRLRRKAERKHAAWRDKDSYGKGVALQHTLGTSADDDAAEGGDASESAEIVEEAEEESEDEDELVCDFCHEGKDAEKGTMHLCEGGDCDQLWHRDCLVPKQDFEEIKDDEENH
ncbi:predicted protein [Micromonas commoda]|uniref:Mutator-like transposase domain-containing protein n=1 Tax=Micromonas commoda (strain RCC299 / NOUM17 / CCMP2709) TaxID=296587 RepID=C1EJP8_MICCC|nr:predicted protein [Micromonas commoda]ACO68227.1 predicted protein [Micromonas commoda]|eukprot:XP_002506969.1 predicted protein [Micromonas commoda]